MRFWVGLCVLLAFAGCRGPKGSPDSSVKSFFSAAGAQDYASMAETVARSTITRMGSQARAEAFLAEEFAGWSSVDVSIADWSVAADEKHATVTFNCLAQTMRNYKPVKLDCSDTYPLVREDDGKWHIELPGTHGLRVIQ
jgi:hypothetical protein